jgi:hypothetical protein
MWGVTFFQEGERFYDLKRERVFESWEEPDFVRFPLDFHSLRRFYKRPAPVRILIRAARDPRWALSSVLRRVLPARAYSWLRRAWRGTVHGVRRPPRA